MNLISNTGRVPPRHAPARARRHRLQPHEDPREAVPVGLPGLQLVRGSVLPRLQGRGEGVDSLLNIHVD